MQDQLVHIGPGFWNIRGSFKVGGAIELGTQCSLVRLRGGGFVLLDSYTLAGEVLEEVKALTDGGRAVRAILNLHPFHTIHVKAVAAQFPHADLYGTSRHVERAPELPWQELLTDSAELHARFADDLTFTVPRGVDFISADPSKHFSSVPAHHPASRTLHVDDTLTWVSLPLVGGLSFHPTLKGVLERRPGAAADFRAWAAELATLCEGVDHLCTAHMQKLPPSGLALPELVRAALAKTERVLAAHEKRFGR